MHIASEVSMCCLFSVAICRVVLTLWLCFFIGWEEARDFIKIRLSMMHWVQCVWGSFSNPLSFCLLSCSGRNTGLFWRITAWDTTRTPLQKRWLHCFSSHHLNVGQLSLFPRRPLCFCRLPTWTVRLTCRPAAMWRSTRHSATTASKYTWENVASCQVRF